MIPPSLMYQMAQDRQAELLRGTEEYRRAGLTVRMRIRARIPWFHTGSRRSHANVVGPSTPGRRAATDATKSATSATNPTLHPSPHG
jgi:hypothetical protein